MYIFNILASSETASNSGMDIIFQSFSDFMYDLTPKHKKRCKLIFIDKGGYALSAIQLAEKLDIQTYVQILDGKRVDKVEQAYEEATLFFLPSRNQTEEIILATFSKGVPILGYRKKEQVEYIDQTCGTFIDYYSRDQSIDDFANIMRILYFDPEACKLLKKGALTKYAIHSNWASSSKDSTSAIAVRS